MTLTLGTFGVITYVLYVAYGLLVPGTWHPAPVLERLLPGFSWLSYTTFVLGLVEAFIYGAYAGALFSVLRNAFLKVFTRAEERRTPLSRAA